MRRETNGTYETVLSASDHFQLMQEMHEAEESMQQEEVTSTHLHIPISGTVAHFEPLSAAISNHQFHVLPEIQWNTLEEVENEAED